MFAAIAKFFRKETVEEAYERGRKCADELLAEGEAAGHKRAVVADSIYAMGFGWPGENAIHRAFDRGLQDRLHELGFDSPY